MLKSLRPLLGKQLDVNSRARNVWSALVNAYFEAGITVAGMVYFSTQVSFVGWLMLVESSLS